MFLFLQAFGFFQYLVSNFEQNSKPKTKHDGPLQVSKHYLFFQVKRFAIISRGFSVKFSVFRFSAELRTKS